MPHAAIDVSTLPDVLAILGSAGSVVGGGVGLVVDHAKLRQALENLALGAALEECAAVSSLSSLIS